jgi:hypothetical protein
VVEMLVKNNADLDFRIDIDGKLVAVLGPE